MNSQDYEFLRRMSQLLSKHGEITEMRRLEFDIVLTTIQKLSGVELQ